MPASSPPLPSPSASQLPAPSLRALLLSSDYTPTSVALPLQASRALTTFNLWVKNGTPGSASNYDVPSIVGEYIVKFSVCCATRRSIMRRLGGTQCPKKLLSAEFVFDLITDKSTLAHIHRLTDNVAPRRVSNPAAVSFWYSHPQQIPPPPEVSNFLFSDVFLRFLFHGEGPAPFIGHYGSVTFQALVDAAITDVKTPADLDTSPTNVYDRLYAECLSRRDGCQVPQIQRLVLVSKLILNLGSVMYWKPLMVHLAQYLHSQRPITHETASDHTSFIWKFELTGSLGLRLCAATALYELDPSLTTASSGARDVYENVVGLATCNEVLGFLALHSEPGRIIPSDVQPFQRAAALRAAVALYLEAEPRNGYTAISGLMLIIVRLIRDHLPEIWQGVVNAQGAAFDPPPMETSIDMPLVKRSKS